MVRDSIRFGSWTAILAAGCTAVADPPPSPKFSLQFATLQTGSCAATKNGSGQIPEDVASLVIALHDGKSPFVQRIAGAELATAKSKQKVNLKVPAADRLDLEVVGCDKNKQAVWYGKSHDWRVEAAKDTTARVFLTPVKKVACTGSGGQNAALQQGRSLMGAVALPRAEDPPGADGKPVLKAPFGDALFVGGIRDWSATKDVGAGSTSTDLYDHRLGQFKKGPELLVPRIGPHVHAISDRKVLVAGGLQTVPRQGDLNKPMSILGPAAPGSGQPAKKAEVLTLVGAVGSAETGADVGAGALPFSSAILAGDAILYAGGLDLTSGDASKSATRLGNLTDVAGGGKGTTTAVALQTARVRPGLAAFPDGTVVVWGGSAEEDKQGEIVAKDGAAGELLAVSGAAAVGALAVAAPLVVPLAVQDDTLALLVLGGLPFDDPLSAEKAPSYVVVVDKGKKTATVKQVAVAGGGATLRAGVYGAGLRLASGHVLLAGGLLALKPVSDVCQSQTECVLEGLLLLKPPADLSADKLELTAELTGSLGGPRFGVAAVGLVQGALLAGGQSSVYPQAPPDSADVLESLGQIATPPLDPAVVADYCK